MRNKKSETKTSENKPQVFADGFRFKRPNNNMPEFIKGIISADVDKAIEFLQAHRNANGYVTMDLKVSTNGNPYLALNEYSTAQNERQTVTI